MSTALDRPTSFDDIETGPESEEIIRQFTDPYPVFDEAKVVKAIKRKYVTANDPAKGPKFIADKIAEAKADHAEKEIEYWEKTIEKAALSPVIGRILAIGMRQNGKSTILVAENDEEEKAMLQTYLNHVTEIQAQGGSINEFNGDGFDTPFIIARCMKYRLDWKLLRNGRYPSAVFHDLLNDWRGGDKTKYISLDKLAEYLKTKHRKNGDGAHFHETFKEDREKAIMYLDNDLIMTEEVAAGLGVVPEREYPLVPVEVIQSKTVSPLIEDDVPFGEAGVAPRKLPVPRAPEMATAGPAIT
jgi:uncharacterized protein YprB with RNaseH-like and TPR domain